MLAKIGSSAVSMVNKDFEGEHLTAKSDKTDFFIQPLLKFHLNEEGMTKNKLVTPPLLDVIFRLPCK